MKMDRTALISLAAAMAFLCAPAISTAADTSGVTAAVDHALAAFNQGNIKAWVAACDSPALIIDDFPPHSWQAPAACADWASAYTAFSMKNKINDGIVTLGTPWQLAVAGNRAYVVYPATFTYKRHGKRVKETGSVFTLVLHKTSSGWLISAWSWAAH